MDLAAIPPTNNDGDPYILPLDIFKEGYSAYNISNWFKSQAEKRGIRVYLTTPRYSSQQCPICGHIDSENRVDQ